MKRYQLIENFVLYCTISCVQAQTCIVPIENFGESIKFWLYKINEDKFYNEELTMVYPAIVCTKRQVFTKFSTVN